MYILYFTELKKKVIQIFSEGRKKMTYFKIYPALRSRK